MQLEVPGFLWAHGCFGRTRLSKFRKFLSIWFQSASCANNYTHFWGVCVSYSCCARLHSDTTLPPSPLPGAAPALPPPRLQGSPSPSGLLHPDGRSPRPLTAREFTREQRSRPVDRTLDDGGHVSWTREAPGPHDVVRYCPGARAAACAPPASPARTTPPRPGCWQARPQGSERGPRTCRERSYLQWLRRGKRLRCGVCAAGRGGRALVTPPPAPGNTPGRWVQRPAADF